ncbi:outer membrane beta-barrel protein [Neolewinella antarctica]|uniref:Opacity protein-like surface antigen n=1 Tax=Neolewinella antarctica TaxID=442734 RepID=A0ABX0XBZ7_9BACT|nr:outer membrane beta-barrel protein [Neolewinella antarctica]NJC26600.1 opacity protein-like surface antigen [Neolewinella antarctica]
MKINILPKTLLMLVAFATSAGVSAQVSGLSYTLQPTANYNWFDNQSGLDDAFMYGGRLGLGFGENVELRGLYMQSLSSSTNFGDFDFGTDAFDDLGENDVDITRYGGEVKLNLSQGRFLPYLTLGAGIQEFELDGGDSPNLQSETIYAAAGLGVTLSIFDRLTLNVEARNTSFNQNAIQNLVSADDRDRINLDPTDFTSDRLYNWSLGAGLQFYLGGRRPGTLSDVDRAYAETFNSGFRNVSLLVEPTLSRINWDDAMPYQDTYLGGASLGLDFGPLVGARLFYYRSMEDDEINLDFDDLSMYGADFRFRLTSVTTGLSPFLTVGGGYIDVQDDYLDRNGEFGLAPSQAFATGGGGISLNITPNFRLTGTYRALLTSASDVEDINGTDQIRVSNQWSAGVNLAFGKRAKRPDAVFASTAEARLKAQQTEDQIKMQAAMAEQARKNAEATNQLKADYEVRLMELNDDLDQARINRDTALIASLESELEETEEVIDELGDRSEDYVKTIEQAQSDSMSLRVRADSENLAASRRINAAPATVQSRQNFNVNNGGNGRISLTPAELEGLIEEIFEGINDGMQMLPPPPGMSGQNFQFRANGTGTDSTSVRQMERDIANLRSSIDELRKESARAREDDKASIRKEMKQSTDEILKEIRDMRSDVTRQMDSKLDMTDKERKRMDKEAADDVKEAARAAEKEAEEAAKAAEKAAKKNRNN